MGLQWIQKTSLPRGHFQVDLQQRISCKKELHLWILTTIILRRTSKNANVPVQLHDILVSSHGKLQHGLDDWMSVYSICHSSLIFINPTHKDSTHCGCVPTFSGCPVAAPWRPLQRNQRLPQAKPMVTLKRRHISGLSRYPLKSKSWEPANFEVIKMSSTRSWKNGSMYLIQQALDSKKCWFFLTH